MAVSVDLRQPSEGQIHVFANQPFAYADALRAAANAIEEHVTAVSAISVTIFADHMVGIIIDVDTWDGDDDA